MLEEKNVIRAAQILGAYTAGRFDIWALAGRAKAKCRQHVMTVLLKGEDAEKNVPQKDCGVTMIRTKFYEFVKPDGNCPAAREDYFAKWCKSVAQGMTDEMFLDYFNDHLTVEVWAEHHGIDDVAKASAMIDSYRQIRDHHMGITPKV